MPPLLGPAGHRHTAKVPSENIFNTANVPSENIFNTAAVPSWKYAATCFNTVPASTYKVLSTRIRSAQNFMTICALWKNPHGQLYLRGRGARVQTRSRGGLGWDRGLCIRKGSVPYPTQLPTPGTCESSGSSSPTVWLVFIAPGDDFLFHHQDQGSLIGVVGGRP